MAAIARACLVVVTVLVALHFPFLVEGAAASGTAGRLPVKRRRQVHSLLKRLNKPPIAGIQSPDGDIIDCVHISKQPAFDHPFLKNHTIKMQPSYHLGGLYDESNIPSQSIIQVWQQNGRCPENTIPMRRTKEEDVKRASSVKRYGKKRPSSIGNLISVNRERFDLMSGHLHAVAHAPQDTYYGTNTSINLWQPTIDMRANGFSLAQVWVTAGSFDNKDLNTIEAGWQVSPKLYGDNNTRLFIYWTRNAYQGTGCYNLKCSGFIQINNRIALGGSISPVSTYGGTQYDINIFIRKDPKDGNWWLHMENDVLGYWPSSIFSHLADNASMIMWGGEVYSELDTSQTSTQMGSGHFPEEGLGKAGYIRNIQVIDSSNNLTSPNVVYLITQRPNCYNVSSGNNSDWGTYIYYGGPGRNPNCP